MSDTIIVALITILGGSVIGGSFALIQFILKLKFDKQVRAEDREDKKDEQANFLRKEFKKSLEDNNANWKTTYCDRNYKLTEENAKAINELARITKEQAANYDLVAQTLDSLSKKTEIISDGVKSTLYDKIIISTDKYLSRCDNGAITIAEQANIEQLYKSYSGLGGNGEGKKRYELAMEMRVVTDAEAARLDFDKRQQLCEAIVS